MLMLRRSLIVWSALLTITVAASASLLATGCKSAKKGPAERAGARIDRAADRTGDAIENTGRKINEALPGD
jgi:hypothetical protein